MYCRSHERSSSNRLASFLPSIVAELLFGVFAGQRRKKTTGIGSDYPSHLALPKVELMCCFSLVTGRSSHKKITGSGTSCDLLSAVQSAVAEDLKLPTKMCDAGVISTGSDTFSFEDIVVDGTGAIELNDKGQVAVYGYIADVDFGPELNDRINAKISTVDVCYDTIGVVQTDTKVAIDLVLTPDDFTDADAWKNIRRTMLRLNENMVNANSLVRLDGQFGIYDNTFGLYFRAKSLDVIASFKTGNSGWAQARHSELLNTNYLMLNAKNVASGSSSTATAASKATFLN